MLALVLAADANPAADISAIATARCKVSFFRMTVSLWVCECETAVFQLVAMRSVRLRTQTRICAFLFCTLAHSALYPGGDNETS
jgi:hypothetical protein